MYPIPAPLQPGDQGAEVANLQDALIWLYSHGAFKTYDPPNQPTAEGLKALFEKLAGERASQSFGDATRQVLIHFQIQQGLGDNLHGVVETTTAEHLNKSLLNTGVVFGGEYQVFGTVTDPQGAPQDAVLISAWDRDLRHRQLLGKVVATDAAGRYAIDYQPGDFSVGEAPTRTAPWLIVEARRTADGEVLQSIELPPGQVAKVQQVDLQVPTAPSTIDPEYTRLSQALPPLLKGQGASPDFDLLPHELSAADWPFLTEETGFGIPALQAYADGARMLHDALALLSPHEDAKCVKLLHSAGGAWFYAAARQGLASVLTYALQRSADDWARAYTNATAANQVSRLPPKIQQQLQDCLDWVRSLHQIAAKPEATEPVAKVLTVLGVPVPRTVALKAQEVIDKSGAVDPDVVWKTLSLELPGEAKESARLVRGLRLHQLTDGQSGLMRALHEHLGDSNGDDGLAPLAALPATQWVKLSAVAGATPEAGVDMQRRVELQHPVHALQMRMEGGQLKFNDSIGREVQSLLGDKPEYVAELMTGKTPAKGTKLSQPEMVLKHMGTSMRMGFNLELAGHFAQHGYLKPTNFMHADIEVLNKVAGELSPEFNTQELIERYREGALKFVEIGKDIAINVGIHGWSPDWDFDEPPIKNELTDNELGALPDIPSLFGDQDECTCRPCESMLGQPAYLVDLLELLRGETGQDRLSPALEALIGTHGKRPGIANLPLTCEKNETVVTHIELVLEILEGAALQGAATTPSISADVYADAQLMQAIFPWSLPFSQARTEATAYFGQLGVDRDLFLRRLGASIEERTAATLGLPYPRNGNSDLAWTLLTTDRYGEDLWNAYGLSASVPADFADPASQENLGGKAAPDVLSRISVLLERTGLEFDAFIEAISTSYVGRATINARKQCKTSKMTLILPTKLLDDLGQDRSKTLQVVLNRIHRIVRLKAKFPAWSFAELDEAILACDGIDQATGTTPTQRETLLNALACIKRMVDRNHLPVSQLCKNPLANAIPDIAAALGLRPFQFELLARLAGMNIAQSSPDWAALEDCLLLNEQIQASGVSIEDLGLLFLPQDEIRHWIQPLPVDYLRAETTDPAVDNFLRTLRLDLRAASGTGAGLAQRERVLLLLGEMFSEADLVMVVSAIEAASAEDTKAVIAERKPLEPAQTDRVVELLTTRPVKSGPHGDWQPLMSESNARLLCMVATDANTAPQSQDVRFGSLLVALLTQIEAARAVARRRVLIDAVAQHFTVPENDASEFLGNSLKIDDSTYAADVFLKVEFWGSDDQISPPIWQWHARLHRLLAFKARLNNPALFEMIQARFAWHKLLEMDTPAIAPANRAEATARRREVMDALWLTHAERLSTPVMWNLFKELDDTEGQDSDHYTAAIDILASRVQWPSDARAIVSLSDGTTRVSLKNFTQLKRTYELMSLAKHLRAGRSELEGLRGARGLEDIKVNAVSVLAARLQVDTVSKDWEESDVRQLVQGQINQQRRNALVAYLSQGSNGKRRTANDLYEHYLIDPMVAPCMKTTRVLEAITAVQLFCQRLLFGLEAPLVAPVKLRQQWTWMRNYRVWEANRKVFLFPENWLYPELRDDKSPSFQLLESELGRGELNGERADEAFGKFLDDVANMGQVQVIGMYEDLQLTGRNLYVIGRTRNLPYTYFWRCCREFGGNRMEWRPWRHIELDIHGDHVLPFVMDGIFHIAWPHVKYADGGSGRSPSWEIQMYWSRFDGQSWAKTQTSRDSVTFPASPFIDERSDFTFRGRVSQPARFEAVGYFKLPPEGSSFTPDLSTKTYPLISSETYSHQWLNRWTGQYLNYATSGVRVSARCWVKMKYSDGRTAYIEIANRSFERINARCVTAGRAIPVPTPLELKYESSGSGTTPPLTFLLEGTIFGISLADTNHFKLEQPTLTTEEYPLGTFADIELRFLIDATVSDTIARRYSDTWSSEFEPKVAFICQADGSSWLDQSLGDVAPPPLVPLGMTKPWMNGYKEYEAGGFSNWQIALPATDSTGYRYPFALTGNELFWALASSSTRQFIEPARVWYVIENRHGAYVDLAPRDVPTSNAIRLFSDSFGESSGYRVGWQRTQESDLIPLQNGKFDTDQFPRVSSDVLPDTWLSSLRGESTFDSRLPYASYNWEVFLHAPMMVADQLSRQHKYEEAERWLRYVFDPTSPVTDGDARQFFKFRPFRELDVRKQVIDDLKAIAQLAGRYSVSSGASKAAEAVDTIIERWRAMPFRPFVIARGRIVAFLWRTLFAYLDNLIAWADSLYRQDTRESNNEAMMLYVMARKILGRKPRQSSGASQRPGKTYSEIAANLDDFSNYWVDVPSRGLFQTLAKKPAKGDSGNKQPVLTDGPTSAGMLLFCMPFNDKLNSYWSTVESRLFNLRHCRNIEGVERDLPFTEAPIDPELLVRAVAAGLDLGSVVAGLYAPPPHYRYATLAARANELAAEARSLGGAMLSALEKRDAEQMAQLRSTNELQMLKLTGELRKLQIQEANANIAALRATRQSTAARYEQYQRLLGLNGSAPQEGQTSGVVSMLGQFEEGSASKHSGLGLIHEEHQQYLGIDGANTWANAASISKITASGLHAASSIVALAMSAVPPPACPNPNPPKVLEALGNVASTLGDSFSFVSQGWRTYADQQGMLASHLRRRDDWAFQNNQALKELQQIDKQILANQIRIDITQKELDNHLEQIEQSKAVDEVLRSKFTNADLYEWMSRELFGLYDKTYRMALQLARQAERAFERELGPNSLREPVIGNRHWNSQRDGLLAAERLHHDLKRLELAYLEQNKREFELTKHISLRRLAPEALLNLRVTRRAPGSDTKFNTCEFEIPEWLFDMDTPGHYMRRIKAVSLSIPCVVGPYTSVHCKLTLLGSSVRINSDSTNYARGKGKNDRFQDYYGASDAIVTSTGNADSGLFETQLRDERFLPFEGHGVISRWRLELPADFPQFDYNTISDVVLSIRYTARDGGFELRDSAINALRTPDRSPLKSAILLSCRNDFPEAWNRRSLGLTLDIPRSVLPYWMQAAELKPKALRLAELRNENGQPSLGKISTASQWWENEGELLVKITHSLGDDVGALTDLFLMIDMG